MADDGPGIPPEDRSDVCKLGFSTKEEGGGMGLASARQIVDAHDWELSIEDDETLGGARLEIDSGHAA